MRRCRAWHLMRVFTVCHSSSNFWTQHRVVNCICSNFRTSMVISRGVWILRVHTLFAVCIVIFESSFCRYSYWTSLSWKCDVKVSRRSCFSFLHFVQFLVAWHLTLVLLNQDIPCLSKQCRSRSVGFFNQLASSEANWSGSALFGTKYVNL